MKVGNGSDEAVLKARWLAVASDPSFDGEALPRWPALATMVFRNAVPVITLGVFVGFAGLPMARAEEPVPPSSAKLKRLLAEAMLDNVALKDSQSDPPCRAAISDEAAMKRICRHDMLSLRIKQ